MDENTVFKSIQANRHLPIPHCLIVKKCRRCTAGQ